MFKLIDNTEMTSVNTFLGDNSSLNLYSKVDPSGVSSSASRVTQTASGGFSVYVDSMFSDVDVTSENIVAGALVKNVTNCETLSISITNFDGSVTYGTEVFESNSGQWLSKVIDTVCTSSDATGFRVHIGTPEDVDDSVTREFDFAGVYITVGSRNHVSVNPDYDFTEEHKKIENRHRVRSGEEYVYKWGEFKSFEMTASYVNSGFKSVVNSYWNSNAELLLVSSGGMEVSSVRIVNDRNPINEVIKPYIDLFLGTIQLEGY